MPPAPTAPAPRPRGRRWLVPLLVLGAFAAFGAGIVELFKLRFETGDVYPAYSTLRNDPLGAAAFYEALDASADLRVERNLRTLSKLGKNPAQILGRSAANVVGGDHGPTTCFYLGLDPYDWPYEVEKPGVERLEEILRAGGRVVLTFVPGTRVLTGERLEHGRDSHKPPSSYEDNPAKKDDKNDKDAGRKARRERTERQWEETMPPDLIKRWGIDFQRKVDKTAPKTAGSPSPSPRSKFFVVPTPTPREKPVEIAEGKTAFPVPGGPFADAGEASWHTALDFDVDSREARAAGWQTLYTREGKPVVVARPYGVRGGELILASDSYFLSNEGLRKNLNAGLLTALVGAGRRIIFDESHHGLREDPGLMTLARRYGLQGGLAAVGLLVALFIWRNVLSLVPPPESERNPAAAGAVLGRESAAGFLNLVKRGVPPRELIGACLAQWQGSAGGRQPDQAVAGRLRAVATEEGARPAGQRSPAAAYRAMCAAVRPKG